MSRPVDTKGRHSLGVYVGLVTPRWDDQGAARGYELRNEDTDMVNKGVRQDTWSTGFCMKTGTGEGKDREGERTEGETD